MNFHLINKIAKEVVPSAIGSFFIYDESTIREKGLSIRKFLSNLFGPDCKVLFSIKSNPNPHLLNCISTFFDGFDISSINEHQLILNQKIQYSKLTVSGPCKTNSFLWHLQKNPTASINADSIDELEKLHNEFKGCLAQSKLSIRICYPKTAKKLGVPLEEAIGWLKKNQKRTSGFHFYLGREGYSESYLFEVLEIIQSFQQKYPDLLEDNPIWSIGLGLSSEDIDPSADLTKLKSLIAKIKGSFQLELGRALLHGTAVYYSQVVSVKDSSGQRMLIIEGGTHHNGGALISLRSGYDNVSATSLYSLSEGKDAFDIYGGLCLSNDLFAHKVKLPTDIKADDWLMFYPVGAYNITASPADFIGMTRPKEFLIDDKLEIRDISPNYSPAYHEAFNGR